MSMKIANHDNYTMIHYEKPQSKLKDLGGTYILTEMNDMDNDVYRNAATKAVMAAKVERYSQGTFDLSLLVAGGNADSYFTGKLSSTYDVDYFHVDTTSQLMSRRPVNIHMEMPEGADYDLTVYDKNGNQVGMAVENEDGSKTLTIPCDWSNSRNFVIKVSQKNIQSGVTGDYKLTFSQGEMPQEVRDALERIKTAKLVEGNPEKRAALGKAVKEKADARNAAEISKLHQAQYEALPEELKYTGTQSAKELLEQEKQGRSVSEKEKVFIAIYGNQNDIYQVESLKRKQGLEQEFAAYLAANGLHKVDFTISVKADGAAVVHGLNGEAAEKIQSFVKSHAALFKNVYLSTSKECEEMTDLEYRIAGYAEECNQFLAGISGGRITVDDLSIQIRQTGQFSIKEDIAGLPSGVAASINGADSTSRFYDYKQMMLRILEYRQENGEIPQYHMEFAWNGMMQSFD